MGQDKICEVVVGKSMSQESVIGRCLHLAVCKRRFRNFGITSPAHRRHSIAHRYLVKSQ